MPYIFQLNTTVLELNPHHISCIGSSACILPLQFAIPLRQTLTIKILQASTVQLNLAQVKFSFGDPIC